MSGVLDRQVNGEPITEDEVHAIGVQILTGGFDLATAALSSCVYLLATESTVQDALRRDMSKIPMAAAEFLRLDPQLHHGDRVPARAASFAGGAAASNHRGAARQWLQAGSRAG